MVRTPRFLYFDLGNVLLSFSHERMVAQMAAALSASPNAVREVLFGPEGWEHEFELGKIDGPEFARRLNARFGARADEATLRRASGDIFTLNHEVWQIVTRLLRQGRALGILSNTNVWHWEFLEAERYCLATGMVPIAALSWRLQALKPELVAYRRAARLADCAPEDVFFVDDMPANVEGALAAGFDAVRFVSAEQLTQDLAERGIVVG